MITAIGGSVPPCLRKLLFVEIGKPDLSKLFQVQFQFIFEMRALAMFIITIHVLIQAEIITPD